MTLACPNLLRLNKHFFRSSPVASSDSDLLANLNSGSSKEFPYRQALPFAEAIEANLSFRE